MRRLIALLVSAGLLGGAALILSAGPADAASGDLVRRWGEEGKKPGKLGFIYGLALDAQNRVWVADTSNDRIQRFSANGKFQLAVTKNMDNPEGVAVGPNQWVYVADSRRDKIKVFGRAGKFKFKWGSEGSGPEQFQFPASVAVAPNGEVWVADKDNNCPPPPEPQRCGRVSKFTSTGTLLANYEDLDLNRPNGVAVDPSGTYVYIADSEDDQIVKIKTDGELVDEWSTGNRPSMLTATEDYVWVTNGEGTPPTGRQVQKFESDGDGTPVASWSKPNGGPLGAPCGIVVTPNGKRVFVAEFLESRVSKFKA